MLTVVREIRINAPREHVASYLRDLSRLSEYEPKVLACEPSYPDERSGRARVKGRFLGLPWQGEFEMRFSEEGGFQSRMTRGPLRHMEGGFRIRSVSGGVRSSATKSAPPSSNSTAKPK